MSTREDGPAASGSDRSQRDAALVVENLTKRFGELFGLFLGAAELFAHPAVVSAIFERSHVLVQLLFTPLLAGWSIWMGIAISARSSDVRAAQQLAVFASLPPLGVVTLLAFNVIPASVGVALGLAAALLVLDGFGWRAVAAIFDRERLITGAQG